MKRVIIIALLIMPLRSLMAQEHDTLPGIRIRLGEAVVTATRTTRLVQDVPAQVDVIGPREITSSPESNLDDLLKMSANVNVNRSWGIFSKNSSVTMHGLPGSARILVLEDGFPKNKIGGGSVNWQNINPDNVERIEIIKGPASALYGNNAMGGVINILTKKPDKKLEGSLEAFYGSYNTIGSSLNLSGNGVRKEKGFYWNLNGFYRHGDGYYLDPPAYLDPTDVKTNLEEYGGGTMIGYRFNKSSSLELMYDYYNELRGAGLKIHLDDGSYESTITSGVRSKYTGKIGHGDFLALLYYSDENFFGQKESLNEFREYRILDSYTDKTDKGIWTSWSDEVLRRNKITFGAELKGGDVAGRDIYRTATDLIEFGSTMDIFGLFLQDEISLLNDRLKLIAGIRNDFAVFHNGHQTITDPTTITGFVKGFNEDFGKKQWHAFSPKLAANYEINSKTRVYVSIGTGFIPPDLKDLSQTGKIRKGFRLANPDLKPETLTNYEIGFSRVVGGRLTFSTSVYYSDGRDFQYMIGTGDSIDTGSGGLKPILKPDNIARIAVIGAEMSAYCLIAPSLTLNMSYSYNNSRITEYRISASNPDKNLTGKYMLEVSPHQFYTGITWRLKSFTASLNGNFVDKQWFDDENTVVVDGYFMANLRLTQTFRKHFRIRLDIQNILNTEYIDRKGQLAPGRYFTGGFQYLF